MSSPEMDLNNTNARAAIVNRVHRVVRAEALNMREQKAKKHSLWAPLLIFSSLMVTICYAIWSTLDSYDLAPNGLPDARDQMMLFLLWFVPVTILVLGLVWFKRGRGSNSEAR